jgi:hypothetical protein
LWSFIRNHIASRPASSNLRLAHLILTSSFHPYDAGHGTCWDFNDAALTKLIEEMHVADKVVAAVCHGPTALVPAKKSDGSPLVAGKTVTGFTDEEEKQVKKETVRLVASVVGSSSSGHERPPSVASFYPPGRALHA